MSENKKDVYTGLDNLSDTDVKQIKELYTALNSIFILKTAESVTNFNKVYTNSSLDKDKVIAMVKHNFTVRSLTDKFGQVPKDFIMGTTENKELNGKDLDKGINRDFIFSVTNGYRQEAKERVVNFREKMYDIYFSKDGNKKEMMAQLINDSKDYFDKSKFTDDFFKVEIVDLLARKLIYSGMKSNEVFNMLLHDDMNKIPDLKHDVIHGLMIHALEFDRFDKSDSVFTPERMNTLEELEKAKGNGDPNFCDKLQYVESIMKEIAGDMKEDNARKPHLENWLGVIGKIIEHNPSEILPSSTYIVDPRRNASPER